MAVGLLLGTALAAVAETVQVPQFETEKAREYLQAVAQEAQAHTGPVIEVLMMSARLETELGRHDEAERLARLALDRDSKRADLHSFLADLYIRQDRLEEAARCLRRALELDPMLGGGYRRLGMVLDRLGDRQGAQAVFRKGVQQDTGDALVFLLLGRLLLDQGQVLEATTYLSKACQLDPELASAFYALSQAKSRSGELAAARSAMATFQKLKQQEKATLDRQNTNYNSAEALRLLAVNFHTQLAAFFLGQQREALAETNLLRAIQVAPQDARGYESLASFYLKKARWEAARGLCEELVRRWPTQAVYRANLGTVLLQLKDYPAAITELKRVLELDPNQVEALNNLARFHLGARQNPAEALNWCRRLVTLQPTAANYDLLGWALYANGHIKEAREASAEAVKKDPQNPLYQERLRRLESLP